MASLNIISKEKTAPKEDHRFICRVCHKQFSNYTCPRCNLRYCSLSCYKSHSTRCTESFMRDNVLNEMKTVEVSSETKRRMLQTLSQVYSENDEDVESMMQEDNLEECDLPDDIVEKVIKGDNLVLGDLPEEKQKAFLHAVASGELNNMITPWEPWWFNPSLKSLVLTKEGTALVRVADESGEEHDEIPSPPQQPLPPLKQLSSIPPSSLLYMHLADILYSYCFTLRLYNGDWESNAFDAAMDLLTVSRVLGFSATPDTVSEAIANCLETICSVPFKHAGGYHLGILVLDDVATLLRIGRPAVICAFADLQRLLETAKVVLKSENVVPFMDRSKQHHKNNKGNSGSKRLQAVSKKAHFMLCWANEQSNADFSALGVMLENEKLHLSKSRVDYASNVRKPQMLSKPIIQEVE